LVWDGFVVLSFWQFFRTWPKQFLVWMSLGQFCCTPPFLVTAMSLSWQKSSDVQTAIGQYKLWLLHLVVEAMYFPPQSK
jgi:hypothetical protein